MESSYHWYLWLVLLLCGCGDGRLHPISSVSAQNDDTPSTTDDNATSTVTTDAPHRDLDTADEGVHNRTDTATETLDTNETDNDTASTHDTIEIEAEAYNSADFKDGNRQWYTVSVDDYPEDYLSPEDIHAEDASGNAYLQVLPDLVTTPNDVDPDGHSIETDPLLSPQIGYDVDLKQAGRYYVWVKGFTTDGGQNNSVHVGIDGTWPASGRALQFPFASRAWIWSSNQRGSGGDDFGIPLTIWLDVKTPGLHHITFAMREDGFSFDKWIMTTDETFIPET